MRATSILLLAMACVGSTFGKQLGEGVAEPRHLQFGETVAGGIIATVAGHQINNYLDKHEQEEQDSVINDDDMEDRRWLQKHHKHHGTPAPAPRAPTSSDHTACPVTTNAR